MRTWLLADYKTYTEKTLWKKSRSIHLARFVLFLSSLSYAANKICFPYCTLRPYIRYTESLFARPSVSGEWEKEFFQHSQTIRNEEEKNITPSLSWNRGWTQQQHWNHENLRNPCLWQEMTVVCLYQNVTRRRKIKIESAKWCFMEEQSPDCIQL